MRNAAYTYLDAASSEPLHPSAREVLLAALERGYADPRRLHGPGRDARLLLDNAREVVAQCLGVRRDEVMFTGSGTRAVHQAILGLHREPRGELVAAAVEHQDVLDAAEWRGLVTRQVEVDARGRVDVEAFAEAAGRPGVGVAALQHANHEVGTLQPVADVAVRIAVPLVVDARWTMGRLPLPEGWTAVAGDARQWGGPGGVGVLVVRRSAPWVEPLPSADRFARVEQGFTDIPGALAAAAALQAAVAEREEVATRQRALIDLVRDEVARIPDVDVVGDPVERLPHLVTFSCLYVDGEALVTELDRLGFGVASGSACASDTREPSRVLAAMGALTHGNVRLSLTRDTTQQDVRRLLDVLPGVVAEIRQRVGL